VQRILAENAGRPGHIFNLGHGILPNVAPEKAKFMVECVQRLSKK
jgi:uroporphyrinogen decarboxylase